MELKLEKNAAPIKIIVKNNNNKTDNVLSRCESLLGAQGKGVLYTQIVTSAGIKIVKLILDQQPRTLQTTNQQPRPVQTLIQPTQQSIQVGNQQRSIQTVCLQNNDALKQRIVRQPVQYERQVSNISQQVKIKQEPGEPASPARPGIQVTKYPLDRKPDPSGGSSSSDMLCTICGESFTEKYVFSSHIKNHLREKIERKVNKGCKKFILKQAKVEPDSDLTPKSSPKPSLTCFPIKDEPDFSLGSSEQSSPISDSADDIPNDISQILDEIEKNLEKPIKENLDELEDISLGQGIETPPDSESEGNDSLNLNISESSMDFKVGGSRFDANTPVDPRLLLNHAGDHDYLLPSPVSTPGASSPLSDASLSPRSQIINSNPLLDDSIQNNQTLNLSLEPPANNILSLGKFSLQDILKHISINNIPDSQRSERVTLHKYNIDSSIINLIGSNNSQEAMDLCSLDPSGIPGDNKTVISNQIININSTSDDLVKIEERADCSVCGKSIALKFLGKHLEMQHNVGKSICCAHCEATFLNRAQLKAHEIAAHATSTSQRYDCSSCGERFLNGSSYQRHMKNVHLINLNMVCSDCGARFTDLAKFEVHRLVHVDSRRELCGLCGGKFNSKVEMISHMQKKHSNSNSPAANVNKSHTCSICHKNFTQKSHLNRHLKIHGGDLSLVCAVCKKQCISKADLTRHRVSHVSCNICGKQFDTNVHLQHHTIESHSRELTLTLASPDQDDDPLMEERDLSYNHSLSGTSPMLINRRKPSPTHSSGFSTASSSADSSFVDDIVMSCSPAPSSTYSDSMDSNFSALLPSLDSDSLYMEHENSKHVQNFSVSDISDTSFFDANHQIEEDILKTEFFP